MSTAQVVLVEDFETPDTPNYITFNVGQSIVTAWNTWSVTATGVGLYEAAARAEAAAYDGGRAVDKGSDYELSHSRRRTEQMIVV